MGKKSTTSIETEIVKVTNNSTVALKQIVGAGRVEQYNMAVTYINRRPLTKEIIGSAIEWFTLSAEQCYPPALHALGIIYVGTYQKVGIKKDVDKALEYFIQAVHSFEDEQYRATSSEAQYLEKVIDAQYRAGVIYKEQNKKEEAIKYLKFAVEKEHTDALYQLGLIYAEDPNKKEEAIRYLTLAANQKYKDAPYQLGLIYAEDPETHDLALDYFTKAADQETPNKDAQYRIAMIYLKGRIDLRNSATAISWLNKAILVTVGRPHSGALYQLGLLFINGGEGVPLNSSRRGRELLMTAADQGHMEAQYYVARIYDEGRDVEKNDEIAVDYCTKAAEQGHREAQYYLGLRYEEGRGIDKDEAQALVWLTKAAEENPDAQFYLGVKYEEGRGVKRDESKALEFFNQAIKGKHAEAKTYLLSLIEKRIPLNSINVGIKQLIKVTQKVLGETYEMSKMFNTLIPEGIPELEDKVFYYYTYEICSSQEAIPIIKQPKKIYLYIENNKPHYQMLKYGSNEPNNEEVYSGILEVPADFNLDRLKEVSFVNIPLLHKNIRQIYFDYNDSKTKCWYSVITDKGVKEVGGIDINPKTDTDEIDEDAIKSMLVEELKRNGYCFSKEDNLISLKEELDAQLVEAGLFEPSYEKPALMRNHYEELCSYENNFKIFFDKLIENLMHSELNNLLEGGEAFKILKNNIITTANKLKASQEEICRALTVKFQDSSLMIDTFKEAYRTTVNLEDFYHMSCLMRQLNDFFEKLPKNQREQINVFFQNHPGLILNNCSDLFSFPTMLSAQFLTRRKMIFHETARKCFMKRHAKFYELEDVFVKVSGMASTSNMAYGSNNPAFMSEIQKKLDEENNLFKNICFNLIKSIWNLLLMAAQQTEASVIYDSLLTRQKPTILKVLSSLQDQVAKILQTENRVVFCPTVEEILEVVAKGNLPQDEVEQILLEIVKEISPTDEAERTMVVNAEEMLSLRVEEILQAEVKGILSPNAKKMLETLVGKILQAKMDAISVLTSNIKNTCDLNDIVSYLIAIVPLLEDLAVALNNQKINLNTNKSRSSNLSDPSLKMSLDNTPDKFFLSSAPKKGDSRFRIFRRSENGDLTIGGNREFFDNPLSESGPISASDNVSTPSSSRSRSRRRSRADTNIKRLAVYSPRMVNRDDSEQSPKKSAPIDLQEQGADCLPDSSKKDNNHSGSLGTMIGSSRNVQFSPRIGRSGQNVESPRIGSARNGQLSPQIGSARNGELSGTRESRSNTTSAGDSSVLDQRYSPNEPPCSPEQPPTSSQRHKSSRFSHRLPFLTLGRSSRVDENGKSSKAEEKETSISSTLGK